MGLGRDVIAGLGNANKRLVVCRPLDSIVHHLPIGRHTVNVHKTNNVRGTVVHDVVVGVDDGDDAHDDDASDVAVDVDVGEDAHDDGAHDVVVDVNDDNDARNDDANNAVVDD